MFRNGCISIYRETCIYVKIAMRIRVCSVIFITDENNAASCSLHNQLQPKGVQK